MNKKVSKVSATKKIKKTVVKNQQKSITEILRSKQCPSHDNSLQFYCYQCKCLICPSCLIMPQHIKHVDKQQDLSGFEKELQMVVEHSDVKYEVQQKHDMLNETEAFTINRIRSFFNGIREQIQHPATVAQELLRERETIESERFTNQNVEALFSRYQSLKAQMGNSQQNSMVATAQTSKSKKSRQEAMQSPVVQLYIDRSVIESRIDDTLRNNVLFKHWEPILQSTQQGQLKYLHWFEWGKRRLALYDLVNNSCDVVDLEIDFKIPSFSRSIMFPKTSQIFLFGGEEPECHARKEVYVFDLHAYLKTKTNKLSQKAKMPIKKFDFTLCEMNGWIYILSGKNGAGKVVASCHRYNPLTNQYQPIPQLKYPRYASSAASNWPHLYLFGGRGGDENNMIPQIEVYDAIKNEWSLVQLSPDSQAIYNPVEVCGCLTIEANKILLFGGCDNEVVDKSDTYIFNTTTNSHSFERKANMISSQVFVTPPFLFGKWVFSIGNEYYLKQRYLHKYSIESDEWKTMI